MKYTYKLLIKPDYTRENPLDPADLSTELNYHGDWGWEVCGTFWAHIKDQGYCEIIILKQEIPLFNADLKIGSGQLTVPANDTGVWKLVQTTNIPSDNT